MLLLALLGSALIAAPASATHVACGDTIAQDTTLDSNLRDCPGDGLVIAADDVTIDFAGHTVGGTGGGNGVSVEQHVERFTLVRGTITQFVFGVVGEQARGLLESMRVLDNSHYGVEARNPDTEVRDSLISGNEAGTEGPGRVTRSTFVGNREYAVMTRARNASITKNVLRRNGVGIIVEEGGGTVAHNVVTDSPGSGIQWNYSAEGAIRHNLVARNGFGIVLTTESSADPVVEHNTVVRNHSHGIYGHWEGRGSVITRNEIRRNGGSGIYTTGFAPCPELRDNHVSRNEEDGIFVTESPIGGGPSECTVLPVTGNTASRNGADGIHVALANPLVTLTSNRADHNADLGIEAVEQVTDGGGNRARRNGDSRQCVGVACR